MRVVSKVNGEIVDEPDIDELALHEDKGLGATLVMLGDAILGTVKGDKEYEECVEAIEPFWDIVKGKL